MTRFFKCKGCKNILTVLNEDSDNKFCNSAALIELKAGEVDAATEKHVPVLLSYKDDIVEVAVGSVEHPMTAEHLITFIALETDKGVYVRNLTKDDKPYAKFILNNEKALKVYEYCNLHGLWSLDI